MLYSTDRNSSVNFSMQKSSRYFINNLLLLFIIII